MIYSHEVEHMCVVKKGPDHGPAPIPEEGKWVKSKEIKDISGLTHGVGWCAPQQGACKLTLNVKDDLNNREFTGKVLISAGMGKQYFERGDWEFNKYNRNKQPENIKRN